MLRSHAGHKPAQLATENSKNLDGPQVHGQLLLTLCERHITTLAASGQPCRQADPIQCFAGMEDPEPLVTGPGSNAIEPTARVKFAGGCPMIMPDEVTAPAEPLPLATGKSSARKEPEAHRNDLPEAIVRGATELHELLLLTTGNCVELNTPDEKGELAMEGGATDPIVTDGLVEPAATDGPGKASNPKTSASDARVVVDGTAG